MKTITSQLAGKSNAVLLDGESNAVAVIACKKGKHDITSIVLDACEQHHVEQNAKIVTTDASVLDNQVRICFTVEMEDEGEKRVRDFTLEILPTYS